MSTLRGTIRSLLGATLLAINPACAAQRPIDIVGDCSSLSVAVTAGTFPTFSWDAKCRIEELIVALPGPGALVWSAVSHNQSNSIASPVKYASTPTGAAYTANIVQFLVAGTTYEVTLIRVGEPGGSPQSVGSATFVP